jgi:hypothetical protein
MSRLKNTVKVVISQKLPKIVNAEGTVTKDERNYEATFEDETSQELTSEKVGNFVTLSFLKTMRLEQLQGNDTFKTSKPIEIKVIINGKEGKMKTKISLNPQRFQKAIENSPELIATVFTKQTNIGRLTNSEMRKFIGTESFTHEVGGEIVTTERVVFAGSKTVLANKIEAAQKAETVEVPVVE